MSKSSAIPVQNLPSPIVPEAVNQKDLDALPKNNIPFISTFQRKRILENRLHFLYERYRDRLSVTNAMRDYQDYRHRRLTAAAATSLGLIGVNEMSRVFMRSPLFRYSLMNPIPLVLTATVPFLLATESSTNFLEKHTGNLWRIHKSRVGQKMQDKTYQPSGYYSDKMVDFAWENPMEVVQFNFQELLAGHIYDIHWQNKLVRFNKDFEDFPMDLRDSIKEIRLEIDVPERLKRFECEDKYTHAEMPGDDPYNVEDYDQFFAQSGDDMSPQYNDDLPAVDHGFDEEAFMDLPTSEINQPVVANDYMDAESFKGKNHAPFWIQKLIPTPFRRPEAYESLARNWRQKLGLEQIKKQHAQEIRNGRSDMKTMTQQIQHYIEKCSEEDYLSRIKDIKMRPSDATSTVSKRPLSTLGKEDDKKFFEYEKFLHQLHSSWNKKPNLWEGRGQAVEHISGTYINEKGTWVHQLEGTDVDIKAVTEEKWRQHYQEMIDIQSRYDLINNVFAYDENLPKRTQEFVRDFKNQGGIYEKGLDSELEMIDFERLQREGKIDKFFEDKGDDEEDEDVAEDKALAFNLRYQPEETIRRDIVENLEAVSPVMYPEYYYGPLLKNKSFLKLGSPILRELMMMELEEGGNPEYIDKFIKQDLPEAKWIQSNLEGEFKRTIDNYEPTEDFENIDEIEEYVETMSNNFATNIAAGYIYGDDITENEILFPPKEPGEEEEEEEEAGEEGEEDEEDEEDPDAPIPDEFFNDDPKPEHQYSYTFDLLEKAHRYEYAPNSEKATVTYLLGLKKTATRSKVMSYTERNRDDYRYVDDVIEAYQPWNKDHLELILDSLPKHVFLDIKKPLKQNKQLYETNPYNPFRGPIYEDFWGFLRYDDYRAEMINKRNIAPQISFWRRDY